MRTVREAINRSQEEIANVGPEALAMLKKRGLGKNLDDELWNRLEDFIIQDLFTEAADQEGKLIGARLLNAMQGPRSKYGAVVLKEALGLKVYNRLRVLGGVLFRQQQGTARGGIGTMFVQLAQPGAARGLAQGKIGNFLAIIGLPGAFSRFITSDFGFRLFTQALKVPGGSPEAIALLSTMTSVDEQLERAIIDFYSGDMEDQIQDQ